MQTINFNNKDNKCWLRLIINKISLFMRSCKKLEIILNISIYWLCLGLLLCLWRILYSDILIMLILLRKIIRILQILKWLLKVSILWKRLNCMVYKLLLIILSLKIILYCQTRLICMLLIFINIKEGTILTSILRLLI